MKGICYIKLDRWDEFLATFENYGFKKDKNAIYPEYIVRATNNESVLKICTSKPCINMWDKEDRNGQREIWIWSGNYGKRSTYLILPYIKDLVEAGLVDVSEEK